ncbi:MAG TPA: hypothetical protein VH987_10090 [Candidatus Limnocylindria bacterium]|jgi:hypothetical protein
MGRGLRQVALAVWLPGVALLAITTIVSFASNVTVRELTQDATTVLEAPFYIGSISLLGVILWSAAVAVCLFGAFAPGEPDELRRLLLVSGIFTAVLLFDDAFLLHDEILPRYAGISGELYGVAYLVAMVVYLYALWRPIQRTDRAVLFAALALFAVSAAADLGSSVLAEALPSPLGLLLEDGAKLLAIETWLAYFVMVSRAVLSATPDRPRAGEG